MVTAYALAELGLVTVRRPYACLERLGTPQCCVAGGFRHAATCFAESNHRYCCGDNQSAVVVGATAHRLDYLREFIRAVVAKLAVQLLLLLPAGSDRQVASASASQWLRVIGSDFRRSLLQLGARGSAGAVAEDPLRTELATTGGLEDAARLHVLHTLHQVVCHLHTYTQCKNGPEGFSSWVGPLVPELLPHRALALFYAIMHQCIPEKQTDTCKRGMVPWLMETYLASLRASWAGFYSAANLTQSSLHHESANENEVITRGPVLDVMILISGDYGGNAMSTINSLIFNARSAGSIRIRAVGDTVGLKSLKSSMQIAFAGSKRGQMALEQATFHDMFSNNEFLLRLDTLPFACLHRHNYGQLTWARMLFLDLLPQQVERVVVMDIGDVIVFGDAAAELPSLFDRFTDDQAIGLWQTLDPPYQFNTGIILADVAKLRNSTFVEDFVDSAVAGVRKSRDRTFCRLAEHDVITQFYETWPHRLHVVSGTPQWHYIPFHPAVNTAGEYHLLPAGAIGPTGWMHYCPTVVERIVQGVFHPWDVLPSRPNSPDDFINLLYVVREERSRYDAQSFCGKPVQLVHFVGYGLRSVPYIQWLLRWWAEVRGGSAVGWRASNFRSKTKGVSEVSALGKEALKNMPKQEALW